MLLLDIGSWWFQLRLGLEEFQHGIGGKQAVVVMVGPCDFLGVSGWLVVSC